MKKNDILYYCQTSTKPFPVKYSGKVRKIVFAAQKLSGKINGKRVEFFNTNRNQHVIEIDNNNVIIDLVIEVAASNQVPGYVMIYDEYEYKYMKTKLEDDLEEGNKW